MPSASTEKWTMAQVRDAAKRGGSHWFDRSSMRFFNSRVHGQPYSGPGGVYFVSSEQFVGSTGIAAPRKYSVRSFNPETGEVSTLGVFQGWLDIEDARRAAKYAASYGPDF